MKAIYIYVDTSNPFNSIYLQTKLLADAIKSSIGINPTFIDRKELYSNCGNPNCIILVPFGSFSIDLLRMPNFKNIILIYHNITPAKYFWFTEPLVAIKSILGRLQLFSLRNRIDNIVSVSPYNTIELKSIGYTNIYQCPNILVRQNTSYCKKTQTPSLLYVGRIVQNKDCIKLFKAVKKVSDTLKSPIEFFIVGSGKKHSIYYKRFKRLVLKSMPNPNLSIHWVNNITQKELTCLYQKSWLYITMSKHEGFGLPVCESINNGTPALYTACGGQESVLDNVGLVRHELLANEIQKLLSDVESRERLFSQQHDIINKFMEPDINNVVREVYGHFIQ